MILTVLEGPELKKVSETLVSPGGMSVVFLAFCAMAWHLPPLRPTTGLVDVLAWVGGLAALSCAVSLAFEVRARKKLTPAGAAELPLSFFDMMTGIPNKLLFQDKLSAALSADPTGVVLLIDLADFGSVNDRRGRVFGDAILKELASRLRQLASEADGLAARLGGDRFGLLLPHEDGKTLPETCVAISKLCGAPVSKGGDMLNPKISIGAVSLAELGDLCALGYDTVMSVCNFALFTAKDDETTDHRIYDAALETQFLDLDAMAIELPDALRAGDLEVFLQPRIHLNDKSLAGFEALVRWSRRGDYIPADDLIAMAEVTGLIFELDYYMIDRAVQIVSDWNRRRKTMFSVSVNLSALHLQSQKGVEFILDCLHRHSFPPELLTVEITETANLTKWNHFRGLSGLRAAGCRISIDDFGTGYASLARLRALPADEIKIDRMLISELVTSTDARHVLDAVLLLARNLSMDVVIEGIETEEQLALLRDMGCKMGQGYLLGRPRSALDCLADATYGSANEEPAA